MEMFETVKWSTAARLKLWQLQRDQISPDGVCFLGDSDFTTWEDFEKDMSDLHGSFNAGFGGSRLSDLRNWVNELCIDFKPRMVVLHGGANDWDTAARGASSKDVAKTAFAHLSEIVEQIKISLGSSVPIVLVLTPRRPEHSDIKFEFLSLIADDAKTLEQEVSSFHVCDLRQALQLDANAYSDGVHMTRDGQFKKAQVLLPRLQQLDPSERQTDSPGEPTNSQVNVTPSYCCCNGRKSMHET